MMETEKSQKRGAAAVGSGTKSGGIESHDGRGKGQMAHMRVSSYDAQNYHLQKNAVSSSLRASNHKKNSIVSTSHQGPPQLIGAGANIGNAHHVIPITAIHH